jgi:glucose-1-phosphate adenylyltransferase
MSSAAGQLEVQTLAFILAGGEGERLYPLTAHLPKPALPFGAVFRIIDFTLSNLLNSGVRRINVLTQYKQERLHSYVHSGRSQLSNEFRRDDGEDVLCLPPVSGKRYRGTADAVYQNLEVIEKSHAEYVLIVSGDQVYHMNYGELLDRHCTSRADLTIAAVHYPVEGAASSGVIEVDGGGRVVTFEEKPASPRLSHSSPDRALVSMGVYIFSRESLIETLRQNVDLNGSDDFGRDIVPALTRLGRAVVFQFGGYWRDIGTLDVYYQTNLDLLPAGAPLNPYENTSWPTRALGGTKSLQHSWLASQSRVSVDATLTGCNVWMSIVSADVHIDAGAGLEAVIALPGAHIGTGARIRNAIVAENAVVEPYARIGYDAEADRARFPVTECGVVIIEAPHSDPTGVLRSVPPVQPARAIALQQPRRTSRRE